MFNKKNTIKFLATEKAYGLPEPYPAYKHFPEWFVKSNRKKERSKCPFAPLMNLRPVNGKSFSDYQMQNQYALTKDTTVKHCPGIVDYLKTGYIFPAWTDMCLRFINGEMVFETAYDVPDLHYGLHKSQQYEGMSYSQRPEMGMFHKVSSPWYIKTSPGVSIMILDPYWERNKNFTSVSAIVHSDITPIHMKWFFELNKPIKDSPEIYDEKLQVIKSGTPLALIVPFKREKFSHEIEYLNELDTLKLKNENKYGSFQWFTETVYDKFRKSMGILYR